MTSNILGPHSEKVNSDKVIADEELKGLLGKKLRDDKKKKKKGGDAPTTAQ
jgi:hypothetical protein